MPAVPLRAESEPPVEVAIKRGLLNLDEQAYHQSSSLVPIHHAPAAIERFGYAYVSQRSAARSTATVSLSPTMFT